MPKGKKREKGKKTYMYICRVCMYIYMDDSICILTARMVRVLSHTALVSESIFGGHPQLNLSPTPPSALLAGG